MRRTTRSCRCDFDEEHVRSRIAHFTIKYGDAIRTAFETQKKPLNRAAHDILAKKNKKVGIEWELTPTHLSQIA